MLSLTLLDVRTPVEFRELHIPFAKNLPLDQISSETLGQHQNAAPLYLMCRTGRRAEEACRKLAQEGQTDLILVEGGAEEWAKLGFETVRGKKAVSIERQVRIVAGSLVLAGSLLGAFVHIGFIAIPAFVGSGLAFAGITDTCAMGMMLARMPWNQVNDQGETACSV